MTTTTHTHTGCRPHVGHVHSGSRLHGHRIPKAGVRHALAGGPARFTARYDDFGYEVAPNVRPVSDENARPVTCKRCLRKLAGK
jgi:hypothetical protein